MSRYKSLLIASDGSDLAEKAVNQGLSLARDLNAKVTFVTATENWSITEMAAQADRRVSHPVEDYEAKQAYWAAGVLARCEAAAHKMSIVCTTVHAKDIHAADAIVETAKSKACDLIVMSSHGRRGVQRMLLGSVAHNVLTHSKIPVLICR